MNLERALDLVVNEEESSALGENNHLVAFACEVVQAFYDEHGHHFSNYSLEQTGGADYWKNYDRDK